MVSIKIEKNDYSRKFDANELVLLREGADDSETLGAFSEIFDEGERDLSIPLLSRAITRCLALADQRKAKSMFSFSGRSSSGVPFSCAKGVGGIRLHDEWFSLRGGIDQCILRKLKTSEKGRTEIVSQEDIRGLSHIDSDNMGRISIIRRSKPNEVRSFLHTVERAISGRTGIAKVQVA